MRQRNTNSRRQHDLDTGRGERLKKHIRDPKVCKEKLKFFDTFEFSVGAQRLNDTKKNSALETKYGFIMVLDKKESMRSSVSNAHDVVLVKNNQFEDVSTIIMTNNVLIRQKNKKI